LDLENFGDPFFATQAKVLTAFMVTVFVGADVASAGIELEKSPTSINAMTAANFRKSPIGLRPHDSWLATTVNDFDLSRMVER
jgi:hypothetical protein